MSGLETCVLCPRLCRPVCPVAIGTSREAAVPTIIASAVFAADRGTQSSSFAREALSLCVDCGACEAHCHISHPLPALLQLARERHGAIRSPESLNPISGDEGWVAVECDGRPWGKALAKHLGHGVAVWKTNDELGYEANGTSHWKNHRQALRSQVIDRVIIVSDGGAAKALSAAGLSFRWLHELVPDIAVDVGSCEVSGPKIGDGCCGGAAPLVSQSPVDALRLGRKALKGLTTPSVNDGRCGRHLNGCGTEVLDAVSRLIRLETSL